MAPGVNPKGGNGVTLVGQGGADNPVSVCRGRTSRRNYLGNDGPPPKGKRLVSEYRSSGVGLKGVHGGYELKAE